MHVCTVQAFLHYVTSAKTQTRAAVWPLLLIIVQKGMYREALKNEAGPMFLKYVSIIFKIIGPERMAPEVM